MLQAGIAAAEAPETRARIADYLPGNAVTDKGIAAALLRQAAARPVQPFSAPTREDIPPGTQGDLIRYGIALLTDTSILIGPRQPNPAKRYARNDVNCVACHMAGSSGLPATKPFSMPFVNVRNDYPQLDPKGMKIVAYKRVVTGMLGINPPVPIEPDSREMKALLAYIDWLGFKTRPGQAMAGTLLQQFSMPARQADVRTGAKLYASKCGSCHGPQGLGVPKPGFAHGAGYKIPPIAGEDSFNDGDHFYMVPLLTRFLHANMPLGATAEKPILSIGDAYDIAAFVDTDLPRKAHGKRWLLYPNAAFRPVGFAIPEMFLGDTAAYTRARLGPFSEAK